MVVVSRDDDSIGPVEGVIGRLPSVPGKCKNEKKQNSGEYPVAQATFFFKTEGETFLYQFISVAWGKNS